MLAAFRQDARVWSLFFFACGLLPLVNSIEGSFARSLVFCEAAAPLEPGALFSGSAACGDRLLVINEGQALSSWAASCESGTKVLTMVAAAVSTDLYGRRPVLLLGLGCTALSVLFFMLACRLPPAARPLFVLGQALQGAFPVELLLQQVAADLAARPGADAMGTFELQGIVKFLPMVLFGFVASLVQVLELRDYFFLWLLVLLTNLLLLLLAHSSFPETRQGEVPEAAKQGVLAGTLHEFREYGRLFAEMRRLGRVELLLLYSFLNAVASARFGVLSFSFVMSYFSMTPAQVILQALPILFIHTTCTPLVGSVCRRLGMRQGFVAVCIFKAVAAALFVLQPVFWWSWFLQYYLSSMVSGMDALTNSVSKAVFKDRVGKYLAALSICSYGAAMVAAPLYAAAFDAKATAYFPRLRPGLLSFLLYVAGLLLAFLPATGVWRILASGLDQLEEERSAGKKAD